MQKTADAFGVNLSKIENWYKHQRRSLAKKGELIIKVSLFDSFLLNILNRQKNVLIQKKGIA